MAQQALKNTPFSASVFDGLRWTVKLAKAHEGGPRGRAELLPHLQALGGVAGKDIVLIDDLITTGGTLLACADCLRAAGGNVLGAITCGRTVYDASEPPFKARDFDLEKELSDYHDDQSSGGAILSAR